MEARDERVALMNEVNQYLPEVFEHMTDCVCADSRRYPDDQVHGVGAVIREAGDEV
jgi:hypothetical protein